MPQEIIDEFVGFWPERAAGTQSKGKILQKREFFA
jgi:hypothetical protein